MRLPIRVEMEASRASWRRGVGLALHGLPVRPVPEGHRLIVSHDADVEKLGEDGTSSPSGFLLCPVILVWSLSTEVAGLQTSTSAKSPGQH